MIKIAYCLDLPVFFYHQFFFCKSIIIFYRKSFEWQKKAVVDFECHQNDKTQQEIASVYFFFEWMLCYCRVKIKQMGHFI
jgi:hypothetical protein